MIKAFISNRQSGKTQLALQEFLKEPKSTLFVGCKMDLVTGLKQYKDYPKNFTSQTFLDVNRLRGVRYKKIILDEYCFFSPKTKLNLSKIISNILEPNGKIYIYSSPNKSYDREIYTLVKHYKSGQINDRQKNKLLETLSYCLKKPLEKIDNDFNELVTDILTHPQIEIINDTNLNNKSVELNFNLSPVERYGNLFN